MIEIDNEEVWGFTGAIRGMRNPMNSWGLSDSKNCDGFCEWCENAPECRLGRYVDDIVVGKKDIDLMRKLEGGGTPHRTFMRMIVVQCDITAPLYWWKEMDRYRMGKEQISCSTMHKIHEKKFELDDFSHEHLEEKSKISLSHTIEMLNLFRDDYNSAKDEGDLAWMKHYWWQMIQLLPSSYNQKRTCMFSYETLDKILEERIGHKLDEWLHMCRWIDSLPYFADIKGLM